MFLTVSILRSLLCSAVETTEDEDSTGEEDSLATSVRIAKQRLHEEIKRDEQLSHHLKLSAAKQV